MVHIVWHKDDDFSSATIGYRKRPKITYNKPKERYIHHEIFHILGETHPTQRPDRNNYINVYCDNLTEKGIKNFCIKNNNLYDYKKFPYDHNSIVHYRNKHAKSKNGKKTWGFKKITFQKIRITDIDIAKIKSIYQK